MTPEQKETIHQQLLAERGEIVGEIDALRDREAKSATHSAGAEFAERADLEAQQTIDRQLSVSEAHLLAKIDLALERMDNGTYEACLECDQPIPLERLMAKPSVSLCIHCQEKKEAGQ